MLLPADSAANGANSGCFNISCDTSGRKTGSCCSSACAAAPIREILVPILMAGASAARSNSIRCKVSRSLSRRYRSAPWRRTCWTKARAGCGGRLLPSAARRARRTSSKARYLLSVGLASGWFLLTWAGDLALISASILYRAPEKESFALGGSPIGADSNLTNSDFAFSCVVVNWEMCPSLDADPQLVKKASHSGALLDQQIRIVRGRRSKKFLPDR